MYYTFAYIKKMKDKTKTNNEYYLIRTEVTGVKHRDKRLL